MSLTPEINPEINSEIRCEISNIHSLSAFQAVSTAGNLQFPDDLLNHWLILFFYPKDNTPGCTQEAQDFAHLHADFHAADARIFGVSRDSLKSHHNARTRLQLPFDLISDPEEKLCELFNVIKLKKLYGKQYLGIDRSTFLINPQGEIQAAWRNVKVTGHAQSVLDRLNETITPSKASLNDSSRA
jgi:peroxiredoxin Q/BCP